MPLRIQIILPNRFSYRFAFPFVIWTLEVSFATDDAKPSNHFAQGTSSLRILHTKKRNGISRNAARKFERWELMFEQLEGMADRFIRDCHVAPLLAMTTFDGIAEWTVPMLFVKLGTAIPNFPTDS